MDSNNMGQEERHGDGKTVSSMCKTCFKLYGLKKYAKALSSPRGALMELWQKLQDLHLEDNTLHVTHDGKEQGAIKVQRRQPESLELHGEKRRALRKRMKKYGGMGVA